MKTVEELTAAFRAQGLRVTPQRQCIFRLLHGNDGHPSVDALYEQVRAQMPTISLKTVYQTVHDLEAMGEVELIDVGTGSARVDPNVAPHHHLVCTNCGKMRDLEIDFPALRVPARQRDGFSVQSVEVNFRGLCEECVSNASSAIR
jgi:Fur family transcriptional regulator, peroxide stress response regulator